MADRFWNEPDVEPKRKFRWILSVGDSDIPAWVIKKVTKPTFTISEVKHSFINAIKSGVVANAFQQAARQVIAKGASGQQSARPSTPSPEQKSGNPLYKYGCVKGKK